MTDRLAEIEQRKEWLVAYYTALGLDNVGYEDFEWLVEEVKRLRQPLALLDLMDGNKIGLSCPECDWTWTIFNPPGDWEPAHQGTGEQIAEHRAEHTSGVDHKP